jgi:hypothetical protein
VVPLSRFEGHEFADARITAVIRQAFQDAVSSEALSRKAN